MNHIIHYTHCPVCGSPDIQEALSAKDYTVSGETFSIIACLSCTVRFTQDIPSPPFIASYYKSEDYISHTNTSKGIINRLYQAVRKRTLKQKRKLIKNSTGIQNGKLLDVGSGTGAFVNEMRKNGWEVTGLEPDDDARSVGKKLYDIDLRNINEFYKLPSGKYDAITMWHVLEHVHDLQGYVEQLRSLLKENGKLFIAVPNYTSKDAAIYKGFWAGYDVPRHLYHFTPESMKILMEKHGLKIIKHKPMWYDSFYVSMLSSKYKNAQVNDVAGQGKPDLIPSIWNGLLSNLKAIGDVKKCSSLIYIIGK